MAEAKRSKQWPSWREAINRELAALEENDIGTLVDLPPGETALDNTVQFRIKLDAASVIIFKARVCARGDLQKAFF
jgi:hypothetical protein